MICTKYAKGTFKLSVRCLYGTGVVLFPALGTPTCIQPIKVYTRFIIFILLNPISHSSSPENIQFLHKVEVDLFEFWDGKSSGKLWKLIYSQHCICDCLSFSHFPQKEKINSQHEWKFQTTNPPPANWHLPPSLKSQQKHKITKTIVIHPHT